jgi:ABC-type uncharacterized transport system fused permease/ATPase subunit
MTDKRNLLRNLFREQSEIQTGGEPAGNGPLNPATRKRLLSASALQTAGDTLNAVGRLCKPFWIDNPDKKAQLMAWGMLVGSVSLSLWQIWIQKDFSGWANEFGTIWQEGGVVLSKIQEMVGDKNAMTDILAFPDKLEAYRQSLAATPDKLQAFNDLMTQRGEMISRQGELLMKDFSWIVVKFLTAAVGSFILAQNLAIKWREWMTEQYTKRWLDNKAFYRMQNVYNSTDNPDQRIAEDVPGLAGSTVGLLTDAARNVLSFATFSTVLWNLSTPFHFASVGLPALGQAPAGFMFYAAAASAAIGTGAIYVLGKKLPWLNYKQQKLEADFRTDMMRVREHAESIALNNSEEVEKDILKKSFDPVITNTKDLINTRKRMMVASSIYANYSYPIPYLIAAPGFWVGAATYGTLMQANYAFGQIQGCFSWFMDNFQALAGLKATVDRLEEFNHAIDRSNADFAKKNDPANADAVKVTVRAPAPGSI